MTAIAQFRESGEYKNFSDAKKELFEKKVREMAFLKDARSISESSLGSDDIAVIKGKLADIK